MDKWQENQYRKAIKEAEGSKDPIMEALKKDKRAETCGGLSDAKLRKRCRIRKI